MYAKLVLRNARRSIQDYLVYLLTMTICVTLFYSFLLSPAATTSRILERSMTSPCSATA